MPAPCPGSRPRSDPGVGQGFVPSRFRDQVPACPGGLSSTHSASSLVALGKKEKKGTTSLLEAWKPPGRVAQGKYSCRALGSGATGARPASSQCLSACSMLRSLDAASDGCPPRACGLLTVETSESQAPAHG